MSFSPGFMTANDGAEMRRSAATAPAVLAMAFMASSLAVPAGYFKMGKWGRFYFSRRKIEASPFSGQKR